MNSATSTSPRGRDAPERPDWAGASRGRHVKYRSVDRSYIHLTDATRSTDQLEAWGMKRNIWALAAALACAGACAGTATARKANFTEPATEKCAAVSRGSVSGVVGYLVPAPVGMALAEQATKKNYNVASTTVSCTFGSGTSIASLKKAVIISEETLSRSLSAAEMQKLLALQQKSAEKIKVVPYSGLGGTAYYMTFSDATIHVESIFTASGKKLYGATVDSNLSKSKLANLVKLAEKL
jgi:hypothetical protein